MKKQDRAQILYPLPCEHSGQILCSYVNATSLLQVVRIANIPNWYFERTVFPGQRLLFEALQSANLEIHTGMMATAILSDKICCNRLRVNEGIRASLNTTPKVFEGALKRDRGIGVDD